MCISFVNRGGLGSTTPHWGGWEPRNKFRRARPSVLVHVFTETGTGVVYRFVVRVFEVSPNLGLCTGTDWGLSFVVMTDRSFLLYVGTDRSLLTSQVNHRGKLQSQVGHQSDLVPRVGLHSNLESPVFHWVGMISWVVIPDGYFLTMVDWVVLRVRSDYNFHIVWFLVEVSGLLHQ